MNNDHFIDTLDKKILNDVTKAASIMGVKRKMSNTYKGLYMTALVLYGIIYIIYIMSS